MMESLLKKEALGLRLQFWGVARLYRQTITSVGFQAASSRFSFFALR